MALDFPGSPAVAQIYHGAGGLYWVWDGIKWVAGSSTGGNPMPPPAIVVVTATATLASGFAGFVKVENSTSAPIIVGLPASPFAGQEITLKDTIGNAGSYPITVAGNGRTIEGAGSLAISFNYGWVDLMFTGSQWVQT
jgi:hypothetical protein